MRQTARAMNDLFETAVRTDVEHIGEGVALLHGFAAEEAPLLLKALQGILAVAPFRNMVTPVAIGCRWR